MSNTQVGPIYDSIIQDVINAVRVDFEENGIDETVLETLKKVRKDAVPFDSYLALMSTVPSPLSSVSPPTP